MAYEKQGFYSGQPLTASQLDAMEDGIIEVQQLAQTNSGTGGGTKFYLHTISIPYEENNLDNLSPYAALEYYSTVQDCNYNSEVPVEVRLGLMMQTGIYPCLKDSGSGLIAPILCVLSDEICVVNQEGNGITKQQLISLGEDVVTEA